MKKKTSHRQRLNKELYIKNLSKYDYLDLIQFAYDNDVPEINIKIPCGCGKTMLMYHFGMTNYKILILVPKINIAEQIKTYFNKTLNKKINTNWEKNHKDNDPVNLPQSMRILYTNSPPTHMSGLKQCSPHHYIG